MVHTMQAVFLGPTNSWARKYWFLTIFINFTFATSQISAKTAQKWSWYCIYYVNGTYTVSTVSPPVLICFKCSRAHFQNGSGAVLFMAFLYWHLHHSLSRPVKKCRCIYVNATHIVLTLSPPILIHFRCSVACFLGGGAIPPTRHFQLCWSVGPALVSLSVGL